MSATAFVKSRRISMYFVLGLVSLFVVLVGFSKTFFIPVSQGTFTAPVSVHIHGAFAFSWVLLYCVQTFLIQKRNIRLHRSLGWLGCAIALGVAATILPAGIFQIERDLGLGLGETAVSAIVGILTSALMFTFLFSAGFYFRNRPDVHKGFLLLATIFVIWPAWFRFRHFFPSVPRPDIWFGVVLSESLIGVALIVDYLRRRQVNQIILWVGAFVIIESLVEIAMFDSPSWRAASQFLYPVIKRMC